jgi:two-component system response regulator DctR
VYECGSVADALRGLSNPQSPPPQWVLLDLMLPDGNGIDVIRALRRTGLPTQVCVVTGCCAEQVNEARRAGAAFAFTKPLDLKRLMCALTTQPVGEA